MALDKSTGSSVSIDGRKFEEMVAEICRDAGFIATVQHPFRYSRNLFGGALVVDVFIEPCNRFINGLIIECTRQNSQGSGDHKIPHKVWTAIEAYPVESVMVVDGNGFDPKSIAWAKAQVGRDWCKTGDYKKLLGVFTLPEFLIWIGLSVDWLISRNIKGKRISGMLL